MVRKIGLCVVGGLAIIGCGGGGGSSAPTTPTAPGTPAPTPTPSPFRWSVTGQVVSTGSNQPIPAAMITPSWTLSAVTADPQGVYLLGDNVNPPTSPYRVDVSANGFVTHGMWIPWHIGTTSGVRLDAIPERAPFSLDFYRKLVRGTYDEPGAPWPVLRWTTAPSFFVKTVDEKGRAIEPEVLSVTMDAIRRGVPAWSGGLFPAPTIETGTTLRPPTPGWVTVEIRRTSEDGQTCGLSDIGQNPGSIVLTEDVCACGSTKIPGDVTLHEVGHAMGFFHVDDPRSIMFPLEGGGCPKGELSSAEAFHAAIAYSRPRGNTDPDQDPAPSSNFVLTPLRHRR